MKSIFSSRRNKSPHNNEEAEKQEASFFGKENKTPFFHSSNGGAVQTKLTVGQPGDKYEKEADSMADAVMSNSTSKPAIQNKEISSIQRESLATPQEDEKLGTAEQRMEEDKLVQEKPQVQKMGGEEEEEGMVSKMEGAEEEEGMVNKMGGEEEEEGIVSKMEGAEEEEEDLQTKSNDSTTTATPGLTQQIKSKSGKGKPMAKNTRTEMESSFGRDFSGVNIHTDQDAVKMNKALGAQAFTHGKDVYFNSGKYNPDSAQGKHLLAHELTHVVQQNKQTQILQRYPGVAKVPKRLEKRVDVAIRQMKNSNLDYVVALGNALEQGRYDVAVPNFYDTSKYSGIPDLCPIALLDEITFDDAANRQQRWEQDVGGKVTRDWTARLPSNKNRPIPIKKGIKGFTTQLGDSDDLIYMFISRSMGFTETIIHEAIHLDNPLATDDERENFVSELRSFYYAEYRNTKPEQMRFERALGDAEKNTAYLTGAGISMADAVKQKQIWMGEMGKPLKRSKDEYNTETVLKNN